MQPTTSKPDRLLALNGLSPNLAIHGTLVQVQGQGVLIGGPAASGKSSLAWALIQRGQRLVVDDSPILIKQAQRLIGKCRPGFEGLLYLEPFGLIDVQQQQGPAAFVLQTQIDLVVLLGQKTKIDRIDLLGIELPALPLPEQDTQTGAEFIEQHLRPPSIAPRPPRPIMTAPE